MQSFNQVLKNRPYKRIYIDAFAGSGSFRFNIDESGMPSLFDTYQPSHYIHDGSASHALKTHPPFDEIIFIEKDQYNTKTLQNLIDASRHPNATVRLGDANQILLDICRPEHWRKRRGVMFLDPFGMNVEWTTLQMIAGTEALDVWFLFALAATVRNLPRLASRLDAGKRLAVSRILGTDQWFEEFYEIDPHSRIGLFDIYDLPMHAKRTATLDEIEAYVQRRLLTLFPHVEPPRRLKAPGNKSLFSLFFAVSNPNPKAIDRASKIAAHILEHT